VTTVTKTRPAPGQRLALGFDERGVAYVIIAIIVLSAVMWARFSSQVDQTDFSMTYIGARILHLGQGARLYDLAEQTAVRKSTFSRPSPLLFEHPPFEALIFQPLAGLPYRTVYIIWALVNAGIWLTLPFLLRPYAPAPRETSGYLALFVLFAPLGIALFQGQTSLAMLLFYSLCFIQLKRGRTLAAGVCLGLALFKFQIVLPFALIFLLRRQWRFLAGFILSGTFYGLLSLIAVGWRGVFSYVRFLATIASDPHNISYGSTLYMVSLQGFFNALLGRFLSGTAIGILVAAVSLGLIVLTASRWQRLEAAGAGPETKDLMFAAAIAVSLAAGSHLFPHDLSPLLLSLFLVAAHFPVPGRTALRGLLGAGLAIFWATPLVFILLAGHCVYLISPVLIAFALGTLQLAGKRPPAQAVDPAGARPPLAPERIAS
jgi:hypothetical protein